MIPPDDDDMIPKLTDAEVERRLVYFVAFLALVVLAVVMTP